MEPIRPLTAFWLMVGLVLVLAGVTGNFASLLAAILAPDILEEQS